MPTLIIDITPEQITILLPVQHYGGPNDQPYEVCHWTQDEWLEDPSITPSIANAIHLAHADPSTLISINRRHLLSQIQHRKEQS